MCTPKFRQNIGGAYFMDKNKKSNRKYSPKFKMSVILDMYSNHLGYRETARKYKLGNNVCQGKELARRWERIYLEKGEAGFYIERRGGNQIVSDTKKRGRPKKHPLNKPSEDDIISENQRLKKEVEYLRAEIEYIKKLRALIVAEEQKKSKTQK